MRLTSYTDYALRVLLFAGAVGETVTITKISAAFGISKDHLRKVVHALAQLGYLHTSVGRAGGITLGMPASSINIRDVVQHFETSLLVECFNAETNTCPILGMCGLKHVLYKAQQNFLATLDQYQLSDIIRNPALVNFARQHQHAEPVRLTNSRVTGGR